MTAVPSPIRTTPAPDVEAMPHLLRQLADLLGCAVLPPPAEVLTNLARAFAARGAGVTGFATPTTAVWLEGSPAPLPWDDDAALLGLAQRGESAVLTAAGGSWLLWLARPAATGAPAVLWLVAERPRTWSALDQAASALAGQALVRAGLLAGGGDRLEERLAQAAHVTSRLSHDFGNLLTGVLGFTELALGQVSAGTKAHRYLQEVWQVARASADWLRRVNLFCRRSAPEFTPTGLPGALAEEEARLNPGQPAGWQLDIPAELPALACDAESLRQALRQVLDNACEATHGSEPVTLTARAVELQSSDGLRLLGQPPAGRYVQITIADRGPGLSDEVRARLFQDFCYSTKPRHRGMGLLITYGILARFGGGLELGPAPGGGTQVRLYFPAAADAVPVGPAPLLIVDEDPQALAEARRILEGAGYRVSVATAALEALALYQATTPPFELVLLAVHLSGVTGPELARRMLLRDPKGNVLFLHAPAGPSLPRDELLSATTLVHKPFSAAVLLQAVSAALRRGRRTGSA